MDEQREPVPGQRGTKPRIHRKARGTVYYLVQRVADEDTLLSKHPTAEDAYGRFDAIAVRFRKRKCPRWFKLLVIDKDHQHVARPRVH